ncbi:helix-turn-helix domain-containing protein [Prolixibacter sp. SD074]|jgi:transcriptional regulator with XRE-family HTH domain|uniref:helix-turn-helix domain-containing protein n=1 Tax=Prolixibacter sp. SD074 TaxID=2652391 RepID=UPI0012894C1D|nr:cupin domain-containing protein [Prolixibacter sp. SD074]GET30206.1 XRE family transcriptional regulator [Prolixibacter sp. SD074]
MTKGKSVGERISNIRQLKEISREELADRCQFTVPILTKLEEDAVIPSLGHLIKISRVLGVRLGTFLDDSEQLGPVISRKGVSKPSASFSNKNSDARVNLDFHSLASEKSDRHMEPLIVQIKPSDRKDYLLSSHEGEEFIYVLEGEIEVTYGKESHTLAVGDSIYYDSVVEHNLHTNADKPATILAVVYAPY